MALCENCGWPGTDERNPRPMGVLLCSVCYVMLEAIMKTRWFMDAHNEWVRENQCRRDTKKGVLRGSEGAFR